MTELTKAQLIKEAKLKITVAKFYPNSEMARVEGELFKIALASLEAEPVAWMRDDADGREYNARNEFSYGGRGIPLYAAPPVPVVPEAISTSTLLPVMGDQLETVGYMEGWNACREAMLQSSQPVPVVINASDASKADNSSESGNQVRELTMWVKRLAHSLKYANSLSCLPDKAMEYLNQNGLISVEDALR